jgi:uncharacterized protein (DUF305 family)
MKKAKLLSAFVSAIVVSLAQAQAPIVQPGAPGEAGQILTPVEAVAITDTSYSPDDVSFMRGMIPHHEQALVMAELVSERTNQAELGEIAGRIKASQKDEIEFMQSWLSERGEAVTDNRMIVQHGNHTQHDPSVMKGMATPAQIAELTAAQATAFDRLFLQLMITHHEGALEMVEHLLDQPGSAYDPVLFEFIGDVKNDQRVEIERMHALLVTLSEDPRANLKPGLTDAGIAIKNLKLISSLPKPPGFVDPNNPKATPKDKKPEKEQEKERKKEDGNDQEEDEEAKRKPTESESRQRYPMLSFSNTDMAFSGNTLVAGNYHGFNVYDLANQGVPELISSVVCPGGQGDVSIVGNLLIMSVQETRSRIDCGLQGVAEDVSQERFRGLRIFDISDLKSPKQVGAVQTCRGSHTHSVVAGPGETGKIIVYNSGTSSIREQEEMDSCFDESPGDTRTALFRIDVVEIPVDDPAASRIVDSPAVFADEETGAVAGLWRGGDHGDDTQETYTTDACHDITVFPSLNIAAGACSGNGILFDITDPMKPNRIDVVTDPGFAYWHSATFNNDGTKVLFTDEWGGGGRPRCRAFDPLDWGADAIYNIVDGKLEFQSYFKIPAPQLEQENCVAHNGAIVPVPGRDIFVQSWYQGGISVIDFTDSTQPVEIAYFDRGPIDAEALVTGGFWSSYWYNGLIYGTEIIRGLDVLELTPSEYLTEHEIAASNMADLGSVFNPQQQFPVSWPQHPQIALAYVDQLTRNISDPQRLERLRTTLEMALVRVESNRKDRRLAKALSTHAADLKSVDPRETRLQELLFSIARQLK